MTQDERRSVAILAGLMSVRMLGLFMVLPILSVFAAQLTDASAWLIGLAVGIYGLAQAVFQLLLGPLSDRFGRKSITMIGLALLMLGSVLGAFCHSIFMLIFARTIQGSSAIGSTIIAWVADLTTPSQRAKAMAVLGAVIGSSFALALIIGSLLNSTFGPRSVFFGTALLAALGLGLVYFCLPSAKSGPKHTAFKFSWQEFKIPLQDPFLLRAYLSSFMLHAILAAAFVSLPFILNTEVNLRADQQWYFYLAIILVCFACVLPLLTHAERSKQQGWYFNACILLIGFSQLCLGMISLNLINLSVFTLMLFIGFTFLEAQLPALVSRLALPHLKGTTLSVYSSMQFLGIFVGGSLGGISAKTHHHVEVFWITTILCIFWLYLAQPFTTQLDRKLQPELVE